MDHGVRDPKCEHCKRALGPLHKHKIKGNSHLPVFAFDFSGPDPHRVNAAQYLIVCVWSLGDMRLPRKPKPKKRARRAIQDDDDDDDADEKTRE